MSPCHQTYLRCASLALFLAIVLTALPAMLNAQTAPAPKASTMQLDDTVPKAELFVGYQWLNPGGIVPDPVTGAIAYKLPGIAKGLGTNLAYNFTKYVALEGNYGVDWNSHATISAVAVGPKFTWRGEGVNFFAHTLLGFERISSQGNDASNSLAAILGGGMDLKLWKPVTLRLFEADYQWAHADFLGQGTVPLDDPSLQRPAFHSARLTGGLVFNFGGAPELPVTAACSIDHTEVMVGEPLHVTVAGQQLQPQAHAHLRLVEHRRQDRGQGHRRHHRHQWRGPGHLHGLGDRHRRRSRRRTTWPVVPQSRSPSSR